MVLASSGYLWKALYASLFRVVCGFALAVTVGVSLGVAMARIRLVNDFFDLVELPRPISPLALFPLAILLRDPVAELAGGAQSLETPPQVVASVQQLRGRGTDPRSRGLAGS